MPWATRTSMSRPGKKVKTLSKKHESFYVYNISIFLGQKTGQCIHPTTNKTIQDDNDCPKKQSKLIPKHRNTNLPPQNTRIMNNIIKYISHTKQPSLLSWKHPHIPFLKVCTWVDNFPNFPFGAIFFATIPRSRGAKLIVARHRVTSCPASRE